MSQKSDNTLQFQVRSPTSLKYTQNIHFEDSPALFTARKHGHVKNHTHTHTLNYKTNHTPTGTGADHVTGGTLAILTHVVILCLSFLICSWLVSTSLCVPRRLAHTGASRGPQVGSVGGVGCLLPSSSFPLDSLGASHAPNPALSALKGPLHDVTFSMTHCAALCSLLTAPSQSSLAASLLPRRPWTRFGSRGPQSGTAAVGRARLLPVCTAHKLRVPPPRPFFTGWEESKNILRYEKIT